jgi:MerR family transcriptional regulator, light-induced transcriptional regulator
MNIHRIHRVSKLTGLSKDVIRVWERRYGLLQPTRGPNRYRLYTDEDVSLLRYIKTEMNKGESIGDLAAVGREELLNRVRVKSTPPPISGSPFERVLGELTQALEPLDRVTFERRLNGAVAVIPFEEALHGILLPLQERVGELWHQGRIDVAVEHYVTGQVQQKMFSAMNQLPVAEQGPKVVVGCPNGEAHEVGAQAVAYRCRLRGCRLYYLGANVPIASLARLCTDVRPALVILSIPVVLEQTGAVSLARQLSEEVKPYCHVVAGGNGALAMRGALEKEHIDVLENFTELDEQLQLAFARTASA